MQAQSVRIFLVNLKTKVDAWVKEMHFAPGGYCETEFLNLLSDIFDEMERRAYLRFQSDGSVRREELREIRAELNIPRKP